MYGTRGERDITIVEATSIRMKVVDGNLVPRIQRDGVEYKPMQFFSNPADARQVANGMMAVLSGENLLSPAPSYTQSTLEKVVIADPRPVVLWNRGGK